MLTYNVNVNVNDYNVNVNVNNHNVNVNVNNRNINVRAYCAMLLKLYISLIIILC